MGKIKLSVNDPGAVRKALEAARGPISLDIETTGVERHDRFVSVGLFLDDTVYIMFAGSIASDIANVPLDRVTWALEPLARRDCPPVIGHNFGFDVFFLRRMGVRFGGPIHCTMQAVKLIDQDRGADGGDVYTYRIHREHRPGLKSITNYQLKDLTPRLTGVRMVGKPGKIGSMAWLCRDEHLRYLASDVVGTRALYDHVMGEIARVRRLVAYHRDYCAPLTPILVQMRLDGWAADIDLIRGQVRDLNERVERLNALHERKYDRPILTDSNVVDWLFRDLKLPWLKTTQNARGGARKPSLDQEHFQLLSDRCKDDRPVRNSLKIIVDCRKAQGQASKVGALLEHVWDDGFIRSTLTDKQATGRISSSKPNLQQVAKPVTFKIELRGLPTTVKARDGLVARPGFTLVAMDLAQADVRVLAHTVASARLPHKAHIRVLQEYRMARLNAEHPATRGIREAVEQRRNPNAVRDEDDPKPLFDPAKGSRLLEDFLNAPPGTDFYTVAATTMFGRPPADAVERNYCKQTILGLINLMGPDSLAKRIGKGDPKQLQAKARDLMRKFEAAYPNDIAYRDMIEEQIAITGCTETYAGRIRRDTSHYWMVTLPRVEIQVDLYGDRYWLDVCPVRPRRRVITCHINAAYEYQGHRAPLGPMIYDYQKGPTTSKAYAILDTWNMEYELPYRNIAWRSIRRVRTRTEEVAYRGLDKTKKPLFNHICQGGTADAAKWMMIRVQPILRQYAARMLMQIHDEMVFEVAEEWCRQFTRDVLAVLQHVPGYSLPMVLEPKAGKRFGSLVKMSL